MPTVKVVTNQNVSQGAKLEFVKGVAAAFEIVRCPKEHVHVLVQDQQFLAFGGDPVTPAALVTVEASQRQIPEEARKALVERSVLLLKSLFGCEPARVTTFFVEHPVENIAVGDQIMQFGSPRHATSPRSPGLSAGGALNIRTT